MIFIFVAIITVVLGGLLLTIATETAGRSGKWGLNLNSIWDIIAGKGLMRKVNCPRCGKQQGKDGKAAGLDDLFRSGWICPGCGASMDKWGKARD